MHTVASQNPGTFKFKLTKTGGGARGEAGERPHLGVFRHHCWQTLQRRPLLLLLAAHPAADSLQQAHALLAGALGVRSPCPALLAP